MPKRPIYVKPKTEADQDVQKLAVEVSVGIKAYLKGRGYSSDLLTDGDGIDLACASVMAGRFFGGKNVDVYQDIVSSCESFIEGVCATLGFGLSKSIAQGKALKVQDISSLLCTHIEHYALYLPRAEKVAEREQDRSIAPSTTVQHSGRRSRNSLIDMLKAGVEVFGGRNS